mmetsp:Transcript_29768/g.60431  ORF Transcript_29768/g.60431 Transcript_29768/m.60431 type:complete len:301 (-) Transcript_29768:380-1282(-)
MSFVDVPDSVLRAALDFLDIHSRATGADATCRHFRSIGFKFWVDAEASIDKGRGWMNLEDIEPGTELPCGGCVRAWETTRNDSAEKDQHPLTDAPPKVRVMYFRRAARYAAEMEKLRESQDAAGETSSRTSTSPFPNLDIDIYQNMLSYDFFVLMRRHDSGTGESNITWEGFVEVEQRRHWSVRTIISRQTHTVLPTKRLMDLLLEKCGMNDISLTVVAVNRDEAFQLSLPFSTKGVSEELFQDSGVIGNDLKSRNVDAQVGGDPDLSGIGFVHASIFIIDCPHVSSFETCISYRGRYAL